MFTIKLRGGVSNSPTEPVEDGGFDCDITATFHVEALTERAAIGIAESRASELLTINDSGEAVEFELVEANLRRVEAPAKRKGRGR